MKHSFIKKFALWFSIFSIIFIFWFSNGSGENEASVMIFGAMLAAGLCATVVAIIHKWIGEAYDTLPKSVFVQKLNTQIHGRVQATSSLGNNHDMKQKISFKYVIVALLILYFVHGYITTPYIGYAHPDWIAVDVTSVVIDKERLPVLKLYVPFGTRNGCNFSARVNTTFTDEEALIEMKGYHIEKPFGFCNTYDAGGILFPRGWLVEGREKRVKIKVSKLFRIESAEFTIRKNGLEVIMEGDQKKDIIFAELQNIRNRTYGLSEVSGPMQTSVSLYPANELRLWTYSTTKDGEEKKIELNRQREILADFAKKQQLPMIEYEDPFSVENDMVLLSVLVPVSSLGEMDTKTNLIYLGSYQDSPTSTVNIYGRFDGRGKKTKTELNPKFLKKILDN